MKKYKTEGGSITSFTLLSIMFFVIVLVGIYVGINNKIIKQRDEIEKIKESYQQKNVDEIYEQTYLKQTSNRQIKIGDYVAYNADKAELKELIEQFDKYSNSGSNSLDVIFQENLNWRVLDKNQDGEIRLIAENATKAKFFLSGASGYNNAVYLLDEAAKQLYNNKEYTKKVENLKIEDIQKNLTYDYTKSVNQYVDTEKYGGFSKNILTGGIKYPSIYIQEKNNGVDGIKNNGTLGLSEQKEPINSDQENETTKLGATQTFWENTMSEDDFSNKMIFELFLKDNEKYWLSSRCVSNENESIKFNVNTIIDKKIGAEWLFSSKSENNENGYSLKPVVTLKYNTKIDLSDLEKDGSSPDKAYEIK